MTESMTDAQVLHECRRLLGEMEPDARRQWLAGRMFRDARLRAKLGGLAAAAAKFEEEGDDGDA